MGYFFHFLSYLDDNSMYVLKLIETSGLKSRNLECYVV